MMSSMNVPGNSIKYWYRTYWRYKIYWGKGGVGGIGDVRDIGDIGGIRDIRDIGGIRDIEV